MRTWKQIRDVANRAKMGDDGVEFVFQLSESVPEQEYPDLLMEEMEELDD